jgi:hypothetical protein
MAAKKRHKDVIFWVQDLHGNDWHYDTFDEAAGQAVAVAVARGEGVTLDVQVSSRSGARWFGGDDAVEVYDEDPEASVHEHIIVKAKALGRIA